MPFCRWVAIFLLGSEEHEKLTGEEANDRLREIRNRQRRKAGKPELKKGG